MYIAYEYTFISLLCRFLKPSTAFFLTSAVTVFCLLLKNMFITIFVANTNPHSVWEGHVNITFHAYLRTIAWQNLNHIHVFILL